MKRILIALGLVLALVTVGSAEVGFRSVSVTATSQTIQIPASQGLLLCNWGANESYHRIFTENDIVGAATTSYIQIPAGSATAPNCLGYSKSPTLPGNFKAISLVCDTAETATVTVQFQ